MNFRFHLGLNGLKLPTRHWRRPQQLPLRWVVTLPFVVQIGVAVGVVSYLSYREEQQAITTLTQQLMAQVEQQVRQELDHYLRSAQAVNQRHIAALQAGLISPQDLPELHRYLILQHRQTPNLTTFLFGTPAGDLRVSHRVRPEDLGVSSRLRSEDIPLEAALSTVANPARNYTYSIDAAGNLGRLLETVDNLDVRDRPWFQQALTTGKPGWTAPFQIASTNLLALNAYAPVYNEDQQLIGVFSVNISLNQLSNFLRQLTIAETGEVLILDQTGMLIANSTDEASYVTVGTPDLDGQAVANQLDFQQRSPQDLHNPVIQAAYQHLQANAPNWFTTPSSQTLQFWLDGDRYWLHITPYQTTTGLDWLILTVVPEVDFTAQISPHLQRTVILMGLTLFGSVLLGTWTAHYMTRSLLRLTQVSQAVAAGSLDQQLPSTPIAEIEILAESFRQMVAALQDVRQLRQTYAQELEQQVARQTAALLEAQRIAQVGSWELDLSTRLITASDELYRIYGADPEVPLTLADLSLAQVYADDRDLACTTLIAAALAHQPFDTSLRIWTRRGQLRHFQIKGRPITTGATVTWLGIVADITDRKQTEALLRQSEARYLSILDEQTDLITRFQADGTLIFVNDAFCRYYGITKAEAIGHNYRPHVYAEDQPVIDHCLASLSPHQPVATVEHRVHVNGTVRWMQWTNRAFYDQAGHLIELQSVGRDIHDRKQAELALRESEARFLEISNTSPANIYIVVRRADGVVYFEHISQAIEAMTGLSVAAVQANATVLLERIHPDDIAGYEAAMAVSMTTLQPFHHEWRVISTAGDVKWLQGHSTPKQRSNGDIAWYGVALDITERKQAEAALQAQEAHQRALIQALPDLLIRVNRAGIYLEFGSDPDFTVVGRPPDLVGTHVSSSLPPALADRRLQAIAQALATQTIQVYEQEIQLQGRVQTEEVRIVPYSEDEVLVLIRDISDRKQAELSLQETNARHRAILSVIPDLMYVVSADGTILEQVNSKATLDLFPAGVNPTGKTIFDLGSPEFIQRKFAAIQAALATGTLNFYEQELVIAGDCRYEEVRCVPMPGDRVLVVIRDISDRKQLEQELVRNRDFRELIFNESSDALFLVDAATLLTVDCNQRAVQLFEAESKAELLHLEGHRLQKQPFTPEQMTVVQTHIQQQGFWTTELEYVTQQGRIFWGDLSVKLIHFGQQQFHLVRVVDISDRKRIEAERQQAEADRQQAQAQLEERIAELNQRHREMVLLSEMSDFLQACLTTQEAYQAIGHLVAPLFPDCAGGVFMIAPGKERVYQAASWGTELHSQAEFGLADCWALRRGQIYWVQPDHGNPLCHHIAASMQAPDGVSSALSAHSHWLTTLCIPMIAQGETLGLFYLSALHPIALAPERQQLARTVAEQLALAIANLNLHETLKQQSIRDPLTGLYNRRYLQEAFAQELARAHRKHHSIGVIMLDIDHFKQFNDTYGHEAGDLVLQTVATLLRDNVRGSDIVCRYGGEELIVILPELSLADTVQRAEEMRQAIAILDITYQQQSLTHLTASFGVASFPRHGTTDTAVMQAADTALYAAKAGGRNQIIVAP